MKRFFKYNNFERKGMIALAALLLLLIIFYYMIPQFFADNKTMNDEAFELKVNAFIEQRALEAKEKEEKKQAQRKQAFATENIIKEKRKLTPFPFNPNNLSVEQWRKIGFSNKQISIIKNYEKRGGKFYKKSDLKKIYGIGQSEYQQLKDFIRIPKNEQLKQKNKVNVVEQKARKKQPEKLHIELNKATVEELKQVKGIGNVFAVRISKYRNLLGGFYDVAQLKEVYGIDNEIFQDIKENFYVDTTYTQKIDVNYATFKEIIKHPYFTYEITKEIVNYREKHGAFKNNEDLLKVPLIFDDLYHKIYPYIALR